MPSPSCSLQMSAVLHRGHWEASKLPNVHCQFHPPCVYVMIYNIWWFPLRHRGTPSHHPFLGGIFHETNQPFGIAAWLWKPPYAPTLALGDNLSIGLVMTKWIQPERDPTFGSTSCVSCLRIILKISNVGPPVDGYVGENNSNFTMVYGTYNFTYWCL